MKKTMNPAAQSLRVAICALVVISCQSAFAQLRLPAATHLPVAMMMDSAGAESSESLAVVSGGNSPEATAPQTTLVTEVPAESTAASDSSASGSVMIGRSNSMYIVNGESAAASWDYAVGGGYKFSKLWSVSALVAGSQDINVPEDSDVGAAAIKTTYSGISSADAPVKLNPYLTLGLPVSRAQNSATFQGSAALGMLFSANPDYLFSKKLALSFAISGTRSFHKFDTGASGAVNNKQSSTQTLNMGWSFTDALSVSLQVNHYHVWSYQGALTQSYNHIEEIGYGLDDNWSFALGHRYGNPRVSIWKADRATANYNATDEDNSIAYGTVTYAF